MFKPAGIFLNSMGSENGPNRSHLVINSEKTAPLKRYCASHGELIEVRGFTSNLGRLCETAVLHIWENPLDIGEEKKAQLQRAVSKVGLALYPVRRKTMPFETINAEYQKFAAAAAGWQEETLPQNESLATLFNILDEQGMAFLKQYRELTQTHTVRYLVETALIIAKEMCQPSLKPRQTLFPNVNLAQYTQLDAVLIPYCSEEISSFEEYLSSDYPPAYEIIEIKTVLRASKTSGPNKLRTLPLGLVREQQGKLAMVILWWLSQGHEYFPFPRAIEVICLRGLLPTVVHEIKIDTAFLDTWLRYLNLNFDKESISGDQTEDLMNLIPVIERELKLQTEASRAQTESLRQRMEKTHEWLEAHQNEKFEQKPLFTS